MEATDTPWYRPNFWPPQAAADLNCGALVDPADMMLEALIQCRSVLLTVRRDTQVDPAVAEVIDRKMERATRAMEAYLEQRCIGGALGR